MSGCPHIELMRLAEAEGLTNRYQCRVCKEILVADLRPYKIGVMFGLPKDDYVAWLRYTEKSIVTCDSDAPGAFKVYRERAERAEGGER